MSFNNNLIINLTKSISLKEYNDHNNSFVYKGNKTFLYFRNDYKKHQIKLATGLLKEVKPNYLLEDRNLFEKIIYQYFTDFIFDDDILKKDIYDDLFKLNNLKNNAFFCNYIKNQLIKKYKETIKEKIHFFPITHSFEKTFKSEFANSDILSFGFVDKKGFLFVENKLVHILDYYYDNFCHDSDFRLKFENVFNIYQNKKDISGFLFVIIKEASEVFYLAEEFAREFIALSYSFSSFEVEDLALRDSRIITTSISSNINFLRWTQKIEPDLRTNYIKDIKVEKFIEWFEKFKTLDKEERKRVKNSLYLLNKGLMRNKNDQYDLLFKAFDALFGVKNNVKNSLKNNLKKILENHDIKIKSYGKKFNLLWDIRNQITHGGAINLEDTDSYIKYTNTFISCPENDLLEILLFLVVNAPDFFCSGCFEDS